MTIEYTDDDLKDRLFKLYGPMIGGAELRKILGYNAANTFNRAKRLNLISVHIFNLPMRRGSFALTSDIAEWLNKVSRKEVK